jgi:hypothetical protein
VVENDLQEDLRHAIVKLIFETVLFQQPPCVSALSPGKRATPSQGFKILNPYHCFSVEQIADFGVKELS